METLLYGSLFSKFPSFACKHLHRISHVIVINVPIGFGPSKLTPHLQTFGLHLFSEGRISPPSARGSVFLFGIVCTACFCLDSYFCFWASLPLQPQGPCKIAFLEMLQELTVSVKIMVRLQVGGRWRWSFGSCWHAENVLFAHLAGGCTHACLFIKDCFWEAVCFSVKIRGEGRLSLLTTFEKNSTWSPGKGKNST